MQNCMNSKLQDVAYFSIHGTQNAPFTHMCDAELHNVDGSATNIFVAAEYVIQVMLVKGDMQHVGQNGKLTWDLAGRHRKERVMPGWLC